MKKHLLSLIALATLGLASCDLGLPSVEPVSDEVNLYAQDRFAYLNYTMVVDEAVAMVNLYVNNPTGTANPEGVNITPTFNDSNVLTQLLVEYTKSSTKGRLGKMKITFNGTPMADGTTAVIVPDSLSYLGMDIAGTITVSFSKSDKGQAVQAISLNNGKLTDANKASMLFNCNLSRTLDEGNALNTSDDVYSYVGITNGVTATSINYQMNIIDSLKINAGSTYFKNGKVSIKPTTYAEPFYVTFGTTSYVNEISVTYQGVTKLYKI